MRLRFILIGLLAGLAGCSGGPKIVPVSGTVRLDGKPLANALVAFNPAAPPGRIEAAGPGSMAVTDDQGHFALKIIGTDGRTVGAVVGEHRVRISTADLADDTGDVATRRKERVPAKYNTNTTLTFTVPPGGTDSANFDLDSH
ncbi:MAG TPA: hypothetical protein VGF55_28065 [Gemmataceae bacterium]|jgi:hypothetical protein